MFRRIVLFLKFLNIIKLMKYSTENACFWHYCDFFRIVVLRIFTSLGERVIQYIYGISCIATISIEDNGQAVRSCGLFQHI